MRRITIENQSQLRDWLSKVGEFEYPQETACIGQEKDGKIVAVFGFNNFTANSCQIHVASVGEYWFSKELLFAMFDYPFNKVKVKVIMATVYKGNIKSLNFCRKLGFVQVGDIPYGHAKGDLIVFAMKRNQCRWLQQGEGNGRDS